MKKYCSIYFSAVVSLLMMACAGDEDYYLKDLDTHERSILSYSVPGQIGVPLFTKTATESKVVVFVFAGSDLTAVKPDIQVSYKAKVTPASGDVVNFTSGGNHVKYTVTAESGETREWDVEIREFSFDLGGTWRVVNHQYYYHVAPTETWGWTGTKNMKDKLPTASAADDDTFQFELTGATPEGNVYGTFVHHAGDDGKTATYIYSKSSVDFGYKFKKLPATNGTWELNFATNTITFNKGQATSAVSLPLEWLDGKQTLVIPFHPGTIDPTGDQDWDSEEIRYSTKFWYTLSKSE
ncbi:DUF5018 domain-containing protein [Pseudochryseolinea flava]|uniref:Uncharacterized protein n=1 Tax=Pseudochryseolinea flava TaxID=2059302 RepID=A0A364XZM6_9BACT|nr:hypothetical protein [Pseudochryseolinea flava]RAV99455.1 hypothetical protein DQQ10_19765 [Pseudochryseolinea flava]